MRRSNQSLWISSLVILVPLCAQDTAIPEKADHFVDSMIRAAQTARTPDMLEKAAERFEADYQYEAAQKVLDAALVLRGQVNGDQSADYGLCLLKIGTLERKSGKDASAHYAKALRLLPGRPETAHVFLYLGISSSGKKEMTEAADYFRKAQNLDISLTGPVQMWTAYMLERHGLTEEAEIAYKAALAAESADSIETFETLTLYGRFLEWDGRDAEAEAIKARATAIRNAGPKQRPPAKSKSNVAESAAPAVSEAVHRIGGGVTPPKILNKKDPPYSEEARSAKYSATVLMQLVVGKDGAPHQIKVLKPAGFGLDDCAVSAVSMWRFTPGQKDGQPVQVYATVEVNFRLL